MGHVVLFVGATLDESACVLGAETLQLHLQRTSYCHSLLGQASSYARCRKARLAPHLDRFALRLDLKSLAQHTFRFWHPCLAESVCTQI